MTAGVWGTMMRARLTVALIAPLLVLVACSTPGTQPAATPLARGPEAPAAGQPPEGAAQTEPQFGLYVVQPGDFLMQIAEQLDVSLDELTVLNGIADPTLILVGQVLSYPLPPSSEVSPDAPLEASPEPEAESPAGGGAVLPGRPIIEEGAEQPSGEATSAGSESLSPVAPTGGVSAGASDSPSGAAVVAGGGSRLATLPLPGGAQLGDAGPFARLAAIVVVSALMLAALLLIAERFVLYAVPAAGAWAWDRVGGLALAQRRLALDHVPWLGRAINRRTRAAGRRVQATWRWFARRAANLYAALRWSALAVAHVSTSTARGVRIAAAAIGRATGATGRSLWRALRGTGMAFWRAIRAVGRLLRPPAVLLGRGIAVVAFALGLALVWLWQLLGPVPGAIGRWFGRVLAVASRALGARGRVAGHRARVVLRKIEPYLPKRRSTPRHTAWRDLSHVDSVDELRLGIEAGELRVKYLPVQHAGDGSVTGFEARAQWQHPRKGLLEADQFMPLTTADPEVGRTLIRFVLSEGARFLVERQGSVAGQLSLFIAVTLEQLLDPDLPALVRSSIAQTQLPAGSVELGVLERDVIRNIVDVASVFEELATIGVARVIDQYGDMTVEQLQQLRPSSVRVSFRASTKNYSAWHFVTRTVKAAASIELPVTATDVKTREEIEFARSLGCQRFQDESAAEGLLEWLKGESDSAAA